MTWLRNRLIALSESRKAGEQARKKIFNELAELKKTAQLDKLIKQREEIQLKAYYLWESHGKIEGNEEYYWIKAENKVIPLGYRIKSQLRNCLDWIGLFGNIAILIAVIAYLTYGSEKLRDLEVLQAWSVITNAEGQKGSGGRVEALELINASPDNPSSWRFPWPSSHFPWVVAKWPSESLVGLQAPKAHLDTIQLPKANLTDANFNEARLNLANLQDSSLVGAQMNKAFLNQANLQGASMVGTKLRKSFLTKAQLWSKAPFHCKLINHFQQDRGDRCTNLSGAELQGADLSGANLLNAILVGAQLQDAFLVGANLRFTEYEISTGTNSTSANFAGAKYSDESTPLEICIGFLVTTPKEFRSLAYPCSTSFPEGFDPSSQGMKLVTKKDLKEHQARILAELDTPSVNK